MEMNEPAVDFATGPGVESNDNVQGITFCQRNDLRQAADETVRASVRKAAYTQGYQAGYADGLSRTEANAIALGTATPRPKIMADGSSRRLKGLPCQHCGVSSYSDEPNCPCCGTPKVAQAFPVENPC